MQGIHPALSKEAASFLSCEFRADEFWVALKQMAPLTTPSPDGMSLIFYKSFWHIVVEDVTAVVLKALNSGVVLESLNSIFITFIPKVKLLRLVPLNPIVRCYVCYYV